MAQQFAALSGSPTMGGNEAPPSETLVPPWMPAPPSPHLQENHESPYQTIGTLPYQKYFGVLCVHFFTYLK